MRDLIDGLMGFSGGAVFFALYVGMFVGWAWWMWMAIHLGSFGMFVFGLAGPVALVAALLGAWSLLFGMPVWLLHMVT